MRGLEILISGDEVLMLFYHSKRIDGHGWKGGGATVLIDARSAEVLIVIRGE